MATCFHGAPEIQGDRPTLRVMNPSCVGYSDASDQGNTVFQQQSQQYLVGVPIIPSSASSVSLSLTGSKYLKATQQLLDELVNVGKDERPRKRKYVKNPMKEGADVVVGVELTTAERQVLQVNKAKLASMLDEVEQRYMQYQHQMQIVASSFEAATGFGSARSYTALAFRTVSGQFRCLRDVISSQIRCVGKNLGEEDCLAGSVGSRLQLAGHHVRQQRGLPERAVSVLRAWLFEHFLHPYPKDRDKLMLAKETGLTRNQVTNWFINARVRLWKPMIEDMYLEESKDQKHDNADDKTRKSDDNEQSVPRMDRTVSRPNQDTRPIAFDESFMQQYRQDDMSNREPMIGGIGRFDHRDFTPSYGVNGVSLTLGLPHCELQTPYISSEGIAMGKRLDMGSVENNYFYWTDICLH